VVARFAISRLVAHFYAPELQYIRAVGKIGKTLNSLYVWLLAKVLTFDNRYFGVACSLLMTKQNVSH
jgi:hypothetical protein